jgi:hypothetical protein
MLTSASGQFAVAPAVCGGEYDPNPGRQHGHVYHSVPRVQHRDVRGDPSASVSIRQHTSELFR